MCVELSPLFDTFASEFNLAYNSQLKLLYQQSGRSNNLISALILSLIVKV